MSSQKEYFHIILSERYLSDINCGLIAWHTDQCLKKDWWCEISPSWWNMKEIFLEEDEQGT